MVTLLVGHLSVSDDFSFHSKEMEFLQLSGPFCQNLLDPVQVFGYVDIDVGDIRVVTVVTHVEWHNANCFPATHQRTPWVALWGSRWCHYYIIAMYFYCYMLTSWAAIELKWENVPYRIHSLCQIRQRRWRLWEVPSDPTLSIVAYIHPAEQQAHAPPAADSKDSYPYPHS